VGLRYETAVRPAAQQWPAWIDDQWDRIWPGLAWFEARPETLAPPLDLAQIALGCLLGYLDLRFADCGWRDRCPGLAPWFAEVDSRPSFATSRPPA
jgi:glutathione S-transferase